MMIKVTVIRYVKFVPGCNYDAWQYKFFRQYTADNGKSIYTVGNRIVTKDDGNNEFLSIKNNCRKFKVETDILELGNEEILKDLFESIDQYTNYIDDYKQQKEAERNNEEIREIIRAFEKVAEI
ncbi:MAG: hypothetical protein II037_07945 [Bacteroidales bacterium]|nr:hypothetical protein [Bacteroidales bacterium]